MRGTPYGNKRHKKAIETRKTEKGAYLWLEDLEVILDHVPDAPLFLRPSTSESKNDVLENGAAIKAISQLGKKKSCRYFECSPSRRVLKSPDIDRVHQLCSQAGRAVVQ